MLGASYNAFTGTYSDGYYYTNDTQFNSVAGATVGVGRWMTKFAAVNFRYDIGFGSPRLITVGPYSSFQFALMIKLISR